MHFTALTATVPTAVAQAMVIYFMGVVYNISCYICCRISYCYSCVFYGCSLQYQLYSGCINGRFCGCLFTSYFTASAATVTVNVAVVVAATVDDIMALYVISVVCKRCVF